MYWLKRKGDGGERTTPLVVGGRRVFFSPYEKVEGRSVGQMEFEPPPASSPLFKSLTDSKAKSTTFLLLGLLKIKPDF